MIVELSECEPDCLSVIGLGDEDDLLLGEKGLELAQLVLQIDRKVSGRRDLVHELAVQLLESRLGAGH